MPLAAGRGSLLQDRELVRKHRLVCANPAQDRGWSDATLQRDADNHPGVSICGHLGTVDLAVSSFTLSTTQLRTGRGLDERRAQTWYHHLNATPWHRLEPPLTAAVADILELGSTVLELAIHEDAGRTSPVARRDRRAARASRARRPRSRFRRCSPPPKRWMVGIAALDRAERRSRDLRRRRPARARARRDRARSARAGATDWRRPACRTPALDGRASPTLGWWPPYEAIDLDGRNQALVERELVDLHLSIVAYIGRQDLPGFVGSDLMRRTMEDLVSTVELGHERDWESVLRALQRLDDRYFEARLRECLRQGFYRLRDS